MFPQHEGNNGPRIHWWTSNERDWLVSLRTIFAGDSDDTDRPRLERESTQLSEDFERHTHLPRDDDFHREQLEHDHQQDEDDIDMNDPQLEKAATRIQASFRGYKTRKELGPTGQPSIDHPSATEQHHDEHEKNSTVLHESRSLICRSLLVLSSSAEGNKDPENEEYDTAAVVKIQVKAWECSWMICHRYGCSLQAAYRGYRTRKDMDK